MKCPFCGNDAVWCENKVIYKKNYGKSYMMYYCKPCDARVGCHNNTKQALGTMANAELREWRVQAHAALDPLWKSGKVGRGHLYALLNEHFGRAIHMGSSDIETCKAVIEWAESKPFR